MPPADPAEGAEVIEEKEKVSILWFRNGLRFHDNESLAAAS